MVKFGLPTHPAKPVPPQIVKFKKLGFDYVEIGIEEPAASPQILIKQQRRILRLLAEYRMTAVGHTPYWACFGSSHEKVKRGWVEEAKEMINVASLLEIDLLNFHFYGKFGQVGTTPNASKRFLNNFSESMKELIKYAKAKNVVLMLENGPAHLDFNGINGFSCVMKRLPDLRFHFDIAHAFVEGGMGRIKDYIDSFGDRLVHIHIHDNHGGEDEHLPLGSGRIYFEAVIRWLKEIDYNRTITLEVFTSYKDAVSSREFLKKLWNKVCISS